MPTDLSTGFQPTPELLDQIQGPIAGLILASPSNPTGSILSRAELARVAAWCAQRGVRIVSDEIYHGITYDEPAETILAFAPRRHRRQQLLEILRHDRLAPGLAGPAG